MDGLITPHYLQTILNKCYETKGKQYKVKKTEFESLQGKVTGMMAEYYKLKVEVDDIDIKYFFCKKLTMFHKIQEIMGRKQGAYEKESYIYNFFADQCKQFSFAPKCYLSIDYTLFVLEDLSEQGYRIALNPHDFQHCTIALRTLAQFHATTITYESNQSKLKGLAFNLYDENPTLFEDSLYRNDEGYLGKHWFDNCINTLSKLIDLSPIPNRIELKAKLFRFAKQVFEIMLPSTKFRNVICHGDLSLVNILFSYNKEKGPVSCKFVDFQALRYNPPAHDVMNYIYLASDSNVRKQHLNELIQLYYDYLNKELTINNCEQISLDQFRESCEYVKPQAVIQTACYATMLPLTEFPDIEKDQGLYKKYVYEDRSAECINIYKKGNNNFKDIIDDMLYELNTL